jgi:hypothetical protein
MIQPGMLHVEMRMQYTHCSVLQDPLQCTAGPTAVYCRDNNHPWHTIISGMSVFSKEVGSGGTGWAEVLSECPDTCTQVV